MYSTCKQHTDVWLGTETGFASQLTSDSNISILHSLLVDDWCHAIVKKEMVKKLCLYVSHLHFFPCYSGPFKSDFLN